MNPWDDAPIVEPFDQFGTSPLTPAPPPVRDFGAAAPWEEAPIVEAAVAEMPSAFDLPGFQPAAAEPGQSVPYMPDAFKATASAWATGVPPSELSVRDELALIRQKGNRDEDQAAWELQLLLKKNGSNPGAWNPEIRDQFSALMGSYIKPKTRELGRDKFTSLQEVERANDLMRQKDREALVAQEMAQNPQFGVPQDMTGVRLKAAIERHREQEETWGEYVEDRLPFWGGGKQAGESILVMRAAKRIAAKQGTPEDFDVVGKLLVEQERGSVDKPWLSDVGNLLSEIPGFAIEFGVTRGVLPVGKKIAAKGATAAAKKVATELGKAAAQTALMPGRVLASTGEQMERSLQVGEDEQGLPTLSVDGDTDSLLEALPRGFVDAYIENVAERSGGALGKVTGIEHLKGSLGRWMAKPGNTPTKLDRLFKFAGFNGVVEEILEERAGEVVRGATGEYLGAGYGATGELVAGDPVKGLQQIGAEAAAFGILGGTKGIANRLLTPAGAKEFAANNPDAARKLSENPTRKGFAETLNVSDEDVARDIPQAERQKIAKNLKRAVAETPTETPAESQPVAEPVAEPQAEVPTAGILTYPITEPDPEQPGSVYDLTVERSMFDVMKSGADKTFESWAATHGPVVEQFGDRPLQDAWNSVREKYAEQLKQAVPVAETPPAPAPEPAPEPEAEPTLATAVGGMGKAMGQGLRDLYWESLSQGKGVPKIERNTTIGQFAQVAFNRGYQTREDVERALDTVGKLQSAYRDPAKLMVELNRAMSEQFPVRGQEAETQPEPATEAPPAATPPKPAPAAAPSAETASMPETDLSDRVAKSLNVNYTVMDADSFFGMADKSYGGTRAEGKYGPSDAYDALELGVNKHLRGKSDPTVATAREAKDEADRIAKVLTRIPSQTNRSGEKDTLQQFSTPPHYAYAVNWLANIGKGDTVLEPSAGTGGLAVHALNAGAKVYGNELSKRRAALVKQLGLSEVFNEDAEQIHNILPGKMPAPSVVVMNPPFSHAGERMGNKTISGTDLKHIDAALDLLAPGGRVVAIIGAGLHGETKTLQRWLDKTGKQYNVRAHIEVGRDVYKGYGTTFPTRVLVIDKTEPSGKTVKGEAPTVAHLIYLLEGVRNARVPAAEQQPDEPSRQGAPADRESGDGHAVPLQPSTGGMGAGKPSGQSAGGTVRPGSAVADSGDVRVEAGDGGTVPDGRGGKPGKRRTADQSESPAGRGGDSGGESARQSGDVPAQPAARQPVKKRRLEDVSEAEIAATFKGESPAPAKPAVSAEAQQAKAEFDAAAKKLAALFKTKISANPMADPELIAATADLTAKAVKLGVVKFRDYVRHLVDVIGEDVVRQMAPLLQDGWARIRNAYDTEMDEAVDVADVLAPAEKVRVERAKLPKRERGKELGEALFESYHPARISVPGARPHPGAIVESSAMAAVDPPTPTYEPALPSSVITEGRLSEIQIESVIYAGQSHQTMLETGERQGYMLGDGTGVGKGRQVAGIILDNWMQGRKKAVWMSVTQKLYDDAKRDWKNLGQNEKQVFNQNRVKSGEPISAKEGILFTTYGTLKSRPKDASKKSRLQQIVDWLGEDFDGVIAFDESHQMGNAIEQKVGRQKKKPSQQALAGMELQKALPKARVVYVSATAATEVQNLAYATRLGLWGKGTAFPTVQEFVSKIADGGVAAMELVSQSMKAMGKYMARTLSYDDGTPTGRVEFDRLERKLSGEQREVYNKLAEGWQLVLRNINDALDLTDAEKNSRAKSEAMSQFWGAHQRFFNQIITAMSLPAVVADIKKRLADGQRVVIQLTNTYEAAQDRALANRNEEDELEDFDITPRDTLLQLVEKAFPTTQYEEYLDDNGNTAWRPVMDAAGNPVQNRQAVSMRDQLLDDLASISVPDSPLDHIIGAFGTDEVAEVTGRKRRVVKRKDGTTEVEKRSGKSNQAEIDRFQNGRKRILIFSEAGGTGASYHADLDSQNQERRVHYLLQAGWRADVALQGLGRTHRSNQKQAPEFILVQTDLKGQKRFISTIARRLAQLGALTKGQREAGSTGIFSAADNLESTEAKDALRKFYQELLGGRIEGVTVEDFQQQTGLRLRDERGNMLLTTPPITQFLNRLLSLEIDTQNAVFDAFDSILRDTVQTAIERGTLDQGMETFRADVIEKIEERTVYVDPSGAKTRYVKLKAKHRVKPHQFTDAERMAGSNLEGFFRRRSTGKLYAVVDTNATITDEKTGAVRKQKRLIHAGGLESLDADKFGKDTFDKVPKAQAESAWQDEVDKLPEFRESNVHLITGAILPIWDRLDDSRPRVYRLVTDEGEQLLGRLIPHQRIQKVLGRLGATADAPKATPKELVPRLEAGEVNVVLVNDWKLRGARVQGERRIELIGPNFSHNKELAGDGIFRERIASKTRYFLPTGPKAVVTFEAITKHRPVAEVVDLAGSDDYAGGSLRPKTSKKKQGDTGKRISSHDIIKRMEKDFDVPIITGGVRGKRMGFYNRLARFVRLGIRWAGELGVATHEVAHKIDRTIGLRRGISADARNELKALDYDPQKARSAEGIAEFMRLWLTHDDAAKTLAPNYHQHFEQVWMPAHPDLERKLHTIRAMIVRWRRQGAGERIKANISKTGKPPVPAELPIADWLSGRVVDVVNKAYAAIKDEGHFLNLFVKEAKQKGYAPQAGENPYELMSAFTQTGPTMASGAIEGGVFSMRTMETIGPSLKEAFAEIDEAEYDTFVSWMYARHAIEAHEKGIEPGIREDDARWWYQQHKSDRYEQAAKKFTEFNNSLLDMLVDAGVAQADTAAKMKKAWETYIPLQRVRDKVQRSQGLGKKLVNLPDPLKRRRGADLAIIDPVQATIERAVRFYERAAQQQVIERTIEVAQEVEGMGGWIAPEPTPIRRTDIPLQEVWPQIADMLEQHGITEDMLDGVDTADLLSIYRPDFFYKGDQPVARTLKNGQTKLYRFDKDLYMAVAGMNHFTLPFFLDITFGKATRVVKLGATGLNASFGLKNPIRDYGTFLFQKKHVPDNLRGAVAPVEMVGAYVYSEMQKLAGKQGDPVVEWYQKMGGEVTHELGLDRKRLRQAAQGLTYKSTKRRALGIVLHPVDAARKAIGVSEVGPRLAEFRAVLEKHGYTRERLRTEAPPRAVLIEAINAAADVTLNFKRQGWLGKWLNRMVPFFNAQVEGFDKFIRTWRDNPKRTFLASAALAASTTAYWLSVKDDDWYEEAPDWLRYGFWVLTDGDGKPIVRIPRPFEWGVVIASGTEAILNAINEEDPEVIADYAKQAGDMLMPDLKPALVSPAIETYFNWNAFENRHIVSQRQQKLDPEKQFTAYNTEVAKQMGEWTGMSPAKIEYLINEQTGGLFRNTVTPVEGLLTDREFNAADLPAVGGLAMRKDYSRSLDEFYDELEAVEREYNTAKLDGEPPQQVADRMSELRHYSSLISDISRATDATNDRDLRFDYDKYKIGLAREALGKEPSERYPSPFRPDEFLPRRVQELVDKIHTNNVYNLTHPRAEREPNENGIAFEERRRERDSDISQARKRLRRSKLSVEDATELLARKWRSLGYRTEQMVLTGDGWRMTKFGERVQRLEELLGE